MHAGFLLLCDRLFLVMMVFFVDGLLLCVLGLVVLNLLAERVMKHFGNSPAGHRRVVFLVGTGHLGEFGKQPHVFGVAVVRSDAGVFLAGMRLTAFLFLQIGARVSNSKNTYLGCSVVGVGGVGGCVEKVHDVSGH